MIDVEVDKSGGIRKGAEELRLYITGLIVQFMIMIFSHNCY